MSGRILRVIGTTEKAIAKAEEEISFRFPPSFRAWLLENNGLQIDGVDTIYPVFDERDPRKTSDSIVRNYRVGWAE
jgi:cell wall assembly regulator SMI1